MGRIRTIKPEFPQSESMGRVSRDARLTFVMLWTVADDDGRLRGNSSLLAGLLFPYDDDARKKIDEWLGELEREGCIVRYQVGKDSYVAITNWSEHQKIDHKRCSVLPDPPAEALAKPREASREFANPRAGLDLDLDQGMEGSGEGASARARAPTATRLPDDWEPDPALLAWAANAEPGVDARREAEKFRDHWKAAAGANARKRDWSAAWRTWIRRAAEIQSVRPPPPRAQARDGPAKSSGGGLASISEAGEAFLERVAAEARARQKQARAAG